MSKWIPVRNAECCLCGGQLKIRRITKYGFWYVQCRNCYSEWSAYDEAGALRAAGVNTPASDQEARSAILRE